MIRDFNKRAGSQLREIFKKFVETQVLDIPSLNRLASILDSVQATVTGLKISYEHHMQNKNNPHLTKAGDLYGGGSSFGTLSGINLIRNYPSLELADGAQPEWWDVANGTLTEEDATGESLNGSPPNERILKLVQSSGLGELRHEWTPANERLLDASESVVSAGVWVYNVDADKIVVLLRDSVESDHFQVESTKQGEWEYLSLSGHKINANNLRLIIYSPGSSDTIYIANPVLNVGHTPIPFRSRGLVYQSDPKSVLGATDPGGAGYTTLDLTSLTSNNTVMALLAVQYYNSTTLNRNIRVRMYGTGDFQGNEVLKNVATNTVYLTSVVPVLLDDGQRLEYKSNAVAGDTESVRMGMRGYWEWE